MESKFSRFVSKFIIISQISLKYESKISKIMPNFSKNVPIDA